MSNITKIYQRMKRKFGNTDTSGNITRNSQDENQTGATHGESNSSDTNNSNSSDTNNSSADDDRGMTTLIRDSDDDMDIDNMAPEDRRKLMRMMRRDPMMMMMMMDEHRLDNWGRSEEESDEGRVYRTKEEKQMNWRLPRLVNPTYIDEAPVNESMEIEAQDQGVLETDAELYTIVEKLDDERVQNHSILKMPSEMPAQLRDRNYIADPSTQFNILMADTSGSMGSYWDTLMNGWNSHVAPELNGRTHLYAFSEKVRLIREGTLIESGDIDYGGTDLTSALMKMTEEVYKCKEKYVKVFLVTDGGHNSTNVQPETILNKLKAAHSKVVDIFVLGVGHNFPVRYSITLRSLLHNGTSNIPSLFWAQQSDRIVQQLQSIANCLSTGVSQSLTLSQSGFSLPQTMPKSQFHLSEWVYYPTGPEQVKNITLTNGKYSGNIILTPRKANVQVYNQVVRQWNSVLIQLHTNKQQLPQDSITFMEKLFKAISGQQEPATSIRARLARKQAKTHDMDFGTLMNKMKAILTKDHFSNELELAENILSTTVGGGKYQEKVLQMRGHTDQDFQNDGNEFMKVVMSNKESISNITITPDDSCRITMTSTVSDIQDECFPELMNTSKFEFLKEFTISGVGVFAPMRDSVTINPWSFGIKSILGQPYGIVSQKAMEHFADSNQVSGRDMEVQLKHDDDKTKFNAVVPVFSPEAAKVMGPVVQTRVYAMCTTFAILKNPHIIDFNIHFASLGVLWVRLLHEYPTPPRPEYEQRRIQSIEATAELYLQRKGLINYWKMLVEKPTQALMTESVDKVDEKTLKCESLIKPMFILHLNLRQNTIETNTLSHIIKMLLTEYIGRCLSHYKNNEKDAKPFSDFFAEELTDETRQREWTDRQLTLVQTQIEQEVQYQLKDFYRLEQVEKAAKKEVNRRMQQVQQQLTEGISVNLNTAKVERLRSVSTAGDVSLPTLRTFVNEIGLPQNTVQELFSQQSLVIYTAHALEYRNSRERLANDLPDYQTAIDKATAAVKKENSKSIDKDMKQKLVEKLTSGWVQAYREAHSSVIQPLTPTQIVAEARQCGIQQVNGIEVTEENFNQVYKRYRPGVGLLGNACQSRDCPHFLVPDRRFNQHTTVERRIHQAFPHTFHRTAYESRNDQVSTVASKISSGTQSRSHGIIPQDIIKPLVDSLASLMKFYKQQGN